jgi:hypothetical protein
MMLKIIFGIFIILHGLVHLFYFGQSLRFFELTPEFVWPDGGWAFGRLLSVENNRKLAAILLVACMILFLLGGIVLFQNQPWWQQVVILASIFSSIVFLLFLGRSFQDAVRKRPGGHPAQPGDPGCPAGLPMASRNRITTPGGAENEPE